LRHEKAPPEEAGQCGVGWHRFADADRGVAGAARLGRGSLASGWSRQVPRCAATLQSAAPAVQYRGGRAFGRVAMESRYEVRVADG
jgi:hypothetical protein